MSTAFNAPIFLKLGGSLITEKMHPHTPRREKIWDLLRQIDIFRQEQPDTPIILGHGSGSYGHVPAHRYQTRNGVSSPDQWLGFAEVWAEARALNHLVIECCREYPSLGAISFPVSSAALTRNGRIIQWNLKPMQSALAQGLMPVVHGDVAFDERLGGTIVSTEEIFSSLASTFPPRAVLIAGIEEGVYQDYPENTRLIPVITPTSFFQSKGQIKGSSVMDVTGGMLDKVTRMVSIVEQHPRVFGQIFSGEVPDSILRVLRGEVIGTVIRGESMEELRDIA